MNVKKYPFHIFRHCDNVQKSHQFFFSEILKDLKGPPLIFDILRPTGVSQIPKGPILQFEP